MRQLYPKKTNALFCAFLIFLAIQSRGQGTSCATAVNLTVNGPAVSGIVSDATVSDPIAGGCGGTATKRDGWYSFTASGASAIVSCSASNRQLVLYAYSGVCGSLSEIGCSNSTAGAGTQTETISLSALTAGATYYVRVVNSADNSMNITSITVATPLSNDDCSGAITLTPGASCTTTAGTTVGATQTIPASSCSGYTGTADDDVWYSFIATSTTHTVTLMSTFDAVLEMRSGGCNGSALNCIDATIGAGTETLTVSGLTVGTLYYVRTYSYGSGATTMGTFTICVTSPAPPPANDNCSGAIALTVNPTTACTVTASGTSASATQSQAACAGSGADDDVWYKFIATSASHYVTATPGTMSDVVLQIFSGTCGSLTSISCTDSSAGSAAEISTLNGLTIGATYYVRVHSHSNGSNQGTFTICVTTLAAPSNDNCAGAASLTVNSGTTCTTTASGTTLGATQSLAGCSGNADDDVWYSFTATSNTHNVLVTPGTLTNAVFQLFSGSCGSPVSISCVNATTGTAAETMTFTGLTIGATYFVRVYSNASGSGQGTFNICITTPPPPPANDNCSGAIALTVNPSTTCTTTTSGTTVSATQSQVSCAGTADDDVWYSFTATNATHAVSVTPGTLSDAVLQVFSGTCGSLSSVACVDATSGTNVETTTLSGLTVGSTYFVRVHSYASGSNQGTFSICVNTIVPPANDNCSGAVALTVNPTSTCTISATGNTQGATQSLAGCSGTADDDVWYKFVATGSTHTVTVAPGTIGDIVFEVNSGSCASPTNIACVDSVIGTGTETTTLTGLTSGTTYYVRVYSYYSGASYQGTFTICVTGVPANDLCAGAIALTAGTTTCTPTSGSTQGATQSLAGCSGTADDDVWYSFTATSTSHTVSVTPSTLYDAVFEIFSGNCAGLTSLICVDGTTGVNTEESTISGLTVGATYFVRVYSYYNYTGDQGTFSICITTPVPSSDDCAAAAALPVNDSPSCSQTTSGTTIGATQSLAGCAGNADDDVWYKFTALGTSHTVTVTPGTMNNAVFEVFSGSCASLASIACVNSTLGANSETTTLTSLTVGTTYYIRIYSNGGAAATGSFTVCISTPCSTGTGTGTTALACPAVISGGLGLSGADPAAIDCLSSGCVSLEATYLQLGQTTSYNVESIPFAPPYQFGCLANAISVNVDDVWSPTINLPFNFCFFGNSYNQCLVSSNGVLTFDLANNSPSGTSTWEFYDNLPSSNLFMNSIFGVYHDIDPSIDGKVGWELITLNTGCRALVASWQGIPMFDCENMLYTGMIVLYENTNIIDVYIEEKNACSGWNDGNAVVGVQNQNATTAYTAPGRNSLDADWSVRNEAWRFVPSGSSITSLKWHEGDINGPVVGTTDTISVCPAVTTTYTAEVSYSLCNGTQLVEIESTTVTVDGNKVWNGSAGANWNTAASWTPSGVPTASDCVVIPDVTNDPIITGTNYDAFAYSVRVLSGGNLTLSSNNNLTVTNLVNVIAGGAFAIKNSGSLIQTDNVANSGIVTIERTTTPVYRFDYTYWNSPVTEASNFTLGMLSQNLTQWDKYYHWIPSVGNGIGNWAQESAATVMNPTKGYIIRAPNSYSFTPTTFATYTGVFTGTPNNGDIDCPISYGTLPMPEVNDQWNLIGNPYPSAVSASAFLNYAPNANVIEGTVYFWTHNNAISASFPDPFYGDFVLNYTASDYAIWNGSGGVAACVTCPAPSGFIASGQAFFVESKSVPGNATFTNAMRVSNNNSQFFRSSGPIATPSSDNGETAIERHRIWLDLTNTSSAFNQLLVGYIEGATLDWDRSFDGTQMNESAVSFYSIIPDRQLAIQGRPLPFDVEDRVPLGYSSSVADNYSIRINHFDGLFVNQEIFIEDKLLGLIHNLKESPYNFATDAGVFDDRFILRFTDNKLGAENFNAAWSVTAFVNGGQLHVRANENIEIIRVYDVAGKLVREYLPTENSRDFSADFPFAQGVYLAKITLADGKSGSRKLMN